MTIANSTPLVSVIIPCRNEEGFIGACIRSVLANDYPPDCLEVIVVDGRSSDKTGEEVLEIARSDSRVRVLDNPSGFVPHALNIGIRAAQGEYVIRMDAHAAMSFDYIRTCVRLLKETGAHNVGGPFITVPRGNSLEARTVAALTSNWIVVGGSKFRSTQYEGWADGAGYGAYPKRIFAEIGFFDERLHRNQDNEFNARIRKNNGRIWITPRIRVYYYNQSTITGLMKQAFNSGKWNAITLTLLPHAFQFRHQAPGLILSGWSLGLSGWLSSSLWPPLVYLLFLPFCHSIGIVLAGIMMMFRHGLLTGFCGMLCALPYHLVYGAGILYGWGSILCGSEGKAYSRPRAESTL